MKNRPTRETGPPGKVARALDWAYVKAVEGIPGLGSAADLAEDYLQGKGSLAEQVNRLIRWQNTKAGTSGFLAGVGGVITLPVTIPANVASVMYVQLRMVTAIAVMGGYDVRDDRVKTLSYACLTGNELKDILKDAGLIIGTKLTKSVISRISSKTITAVNRTVGFRLITKFGEKGAINLGKAVPFVGGIIGGTLDAVATNIIGNVARSTFIEEDFGEVQPFHRADVPKAASRPLAHRSCRTLDL